MDIEQKTRLIAILLTMLAMSLIGLGINGYAYGDDPRRAKVLHMLLSPFTWVGVTILIYLGWNVIR